MPAPMRTINIALLTEGRNDQTPEGCDVWWLAKVHAPAECNGSPPRPGAQSIFTPYCGYYRNQHSRRFNINARRQLRISGGTSIARRKRGFFV